MNQEIFMLPIKDWCVLVALLACFTLLLWKKALPSVAGIKELIEVVNSRGGNIILLFAASLYFFSKSYQSMLLMMNMVAAGTLKTDNVFAHTMSQFLTSTAFGGAFGALLTMMTGGIGNKTATASDLPLQPLVAVTSPLSPPPSSGSPSRITLASQPVAQPIAPDGFVYLDGKIVKVTDLSDDQRKQLFPNG
jgi:hypothetical protein